MRLPRHVGRRLPRLPSGRQAMGGGEEGLAHVGRRLPRLPSGRQAMGGEGGGAGTRLMSSSLSFLTIARQVLYYAPELMRLMVVPHLEYAMNFTNQVRLLAGSCDGGEGRGGAQ